MFSNSSLSRGNAANALDLTPALPSASGSWSDRVGVYASVACVIHCILTPVVLSFSVVLAHFLPSEESTHRILAIGISALGAIALFRGLRRHKRFIVLWTMLLGLSLIGLAAFFGDELPHHWMEVCITVCGSALMITAHRLNHTFCQSCECVPTASCQRGQDTFSR